MSQIWLFDGSVSLILLLFFIALVIAIRHNDLPQGTLPLRLKGLMHLLLEVDHSRRYLQDRFARIFAKSLSFNSFPPLSYKRTCIQTPIRWLFWDIHLPSSWSAGFQKPYSLPQHLVSWIIGLLRYEQNELGLSNTLGVHCGRGGSVRWKSWS